MRRTTEKKQTIEDIANSIVIIAGDDEYLSKIALNSLKELLHQFKEPFEIENQFTFDSTCEAFANYLENHNEIANNDKDHVPNSEYCSSLNKALPESSARCLTFIQRYAEKKLKLADLMVIANHLTRIHNIELPKKLKSSKSRILLWFSRNWEIFQPSIPDIVTELK